LARSKSWLCTEAEYTNHDGQPDRQARTSVLVRRVSSWRWNHAGDCGYPAWNLPSSVAASPHIDSCIDLGAEGCVVQVPRHWLAGMGSYPHVCSIFKCPSIGVLGNRSWTKRSKPLQRANGFSTTPAED